MFTLNQNLSCPSTLLFFLREVELIKIDFSRRRLAVASRTLRFPPALIQIDLAARRRFCTAGYERLHRVFTFLREDPVLRIVFFFVKRDARSHGKRTRGRRKIDQILLALIVVPVPSEHGNADEV